MKVTVSLVTYNHAPYIRQAIDSVLMQKTNFDFELLIGEDDSSDGTREIVKEYAARHPEKIRVFFHARKDVLYIDGRPTGRRNFVNNLTNARGEYIALLEGDDFWTSSDKLQKQVDFLDQHPQCAMCFHDVAVVADDGSPAGLYKMKVRKPVFTLADFLRGDAHIHTGATLLRNHLFSDFPDWYFTVGVGDYPLFALAAEHGEIGFIDERLGAYRLHRGGIWSSGAAVRDWSPAAAVRNHVIFVGVWNAVNAHLNYKYDHILRARVALLHYDLVWYQQCLGNWPEMRKELWLALKTKFPHPKVRLGFLLKSVLIAAFPAIYTAFRPLKSSHGQGEVAVLPK